MKSVIATVIDMDSLHSRRRRFSFDDIAKFRRRALEADEKRNYPGIENIVFDEWDYSSEHVVCVKSRRLIASSRVIQPINGELPFSKSARANIGEEDSEMGRFIVFPSFKSGRAFVALLIGCAEIYSRHEYRGAIGGKIFADVVTEGRRRLNDRTYLHIGFQRTEEQYFDEDYASMCRIYCMPSRNREAFFSYVHSMYRRLEH